MTCVMAHAIFQTFLMMYFMSLHVHVSIWHTEWKCEWKLHHGKNDSCITETRGLNYACAGAKWSAMIYWGKYCYMWYALLWLCVYCDVLYLIFIHFFQYKCCLKLDILRDCTPHIFCHYIQTDLAELRAKIKNFAMKNYNWISMIGKAILKRCKLSTEEYVQKLGKWHHTFWLTCYCHNLKGLQHPLHSAVTWSLLDHTS